MPGAADPAALYLRRESVELAFVAALQRARKADVAALVELLAKDARFTMPPLPTWFQGQADIGRFLRRPEVPHAVAAGDRFRLAGINVLAVRTGRIAWIASCLDPDLHRRFGLPRNCLEATPARSDEFRRGRVSQCSEQRQRSDPERGRS